MSVVLKPVLYLRIYGPIWGNYPHWALVLRVDELTTYYLQIFGEPGTFKFSETQGQDPVIAPHREDINIWELAASDVPRVRKAAESTCIDNDTVMWNCQDWCLEVINELEEDYVVGAGEDEDEEDATAWKRLKASLVRKMGPEI
ncbi:hypothetical protein H2198_007974 [Neophaeococcomyces mojaviensis]|uniref:Uncharacterized protein n=1 Tax=Neophaeococcomyces mojaviensis TaxID=3383035 RepID=A0ACC2ZYI1_9EURO|nr:hypothetical protein H2198_007974 [Knufia sp. JES_112]